MEQIELPATTDRSAIWRSLVPQVKGLLHDENDLIAAMANVSAALMQAFSWHWIGFYRVIGNELVLGPFQGPIACTRIGFGKGVCGSAWEQRRTLIVPDVEQFPGHIACSRFSRSEIVVPIMNGTGEVTGVLDIDSAQLDEFNEEDAMHLRGFCELLSHCH